MNKEPAQWLANAFKEVDWPIPPYLRLGFLTKLAKAIEEAPPDLKPKIMYQHLAQAYGPEYLAIMLLERYSKILHIRDFRQQIGESIKAYFCGCTYPAVCGLIPVFEGVVRKIASQHGRDIGMWKTTKKINAEIKLFVEREINSSNCYGERLVMLEAFCDFIQTKFLMDTDVYSGLNELNRHGILHGVFHTFGESVNFLRLITLIDLLCFSIGLTEGVSMFAPESTAESASLAQHYVMMSVAAAT
jgi:hypothetical protein